MIGDGRFGVGDVWSRIGELARTGAPQALAAATIVLGLGVAVDSGLLSEGAASGLNFLISFGSIFLQYWLLVTLLEGRDLNRATTGRFGGYFLLGIVTTAGILAGFGLALVPGLFLASRWSLSGAILVGSDAGVFEAIGESWHMTRAHFWTILAAVLTVYAPALALAVGGFAFGELPGMGMAGIVLANFGFAMWLVLGCFLSVALYSLVVGPESVSVVFE